MQSKMLSCMRGYVEVEMIGNQMERLINTVYSQGLSVWNIRRTSSGHVILYVDLKSFFKLRPLLRETGCKMKVGRRFGFPFLLRRLEKRFFFTAGLLVFVAGIYLLSQVVWRVDVEGNHQIAYDDVMASARKAGIHPLQWKFRLGEPQELSRLLTKSLAGAAWVGVEVRGTSVMIKIVEQTVPDKKELLNPRHLVSQFDAVITRMIVEKGRPATRVNAKVKKGDLLVSGMIGSGDNTGAVVAKASIKGLVWHKYTIESPLFHRHKVYTGETTTKRYVVIGNRALQIAGYGEPAFDAYESDVLRRTIAWRGWRLPIGWIREELKEARQEQEKVSESDARRIGLMHARGNILRKAGTGAIIRGENILHEKIEGGKVYMTVLFEVEQEIAEELPIVQGD